MKIVIELDIEDIVRQEIRTYVRENIVITNVAGSTGTVAATDAIEVTVTQAVETPTTNPVPTEGVVWEYGPRIGKRRSKAEIALHEKELALGRNLTPEEKGEQEAHIELNEEAQQKAKEDTKNKARIDSIVEEVSAEAAEELAQETPDEPVSDQGESVTSILDDIIETNSETANAEIPTTQELDNLNSLFK